MKHLRMHDTAMRVICVPAVMLLFLLVPGCGGEKQEEEHEGYARAAREALLDGDFDEAISCLEKSAILYPDDASAYLKLALIHEQLRVDKEKAREYYEQYLAVEKDETLRRQAEEWLANLDAGTEAPTLPGASILMRQALELQETEHRREIEKLTAQHRHELSVLQDKLHEFFLVSQGQDEKGSEG